MPFDSWNPNTVSLLAALLSILGSVCGAWFAVWYAFRRLEKDELRKAQVSLLVELYGSRYVLSDYQIWSDEAQNRFLFNINKIGVLFNEHDEVISALRDYRTSHKQEDFVILVMKMRESISIGLENFTVSDVATVIALRNKTVPVAAVNQQSTDVPAE